MSDSNPVIQGVQIRAATARGDQCVVVDPEQALDIVREGKAVVWVDVSVRDRAEGERLLVDAFGFHRLAVEDALSESERPTLQEFDEYLFFALPALKRPSAEHHAVEVGFFLTRNALVTVTTDSCEAVDEWFERWCSAPRRVGPHPAMITHALVDAIVDAYYPLVDKMEDRLDELSESIFSGDTTRVKDILILKREFLEVRRRVAPVRDIVNGLLRRDLQLIPPRTKPYFQDVFDHVIRVSELLDINRETLASLLDVHLSQVSTHLNAVVKKMTVVATVLMIMTLVSSIYGMNFRFMPELHWVYGYPFALALMGSLAVLAVLVFKRIKWL